MSPEPSYWNFQMFEVRVVRTIDELMKVFAVRAATYMVEQACPYAEEFDGNDLCATHFIGMVKGEPMGCLRARFFSDFAKLERLAVMKQARGTSLAPRMVRAAIEHIRRKGYTKIYGNSRKGVDKFWARFGAKPIKSKGEFVVSGQTYIEILAVFNLHPDRMSLDTDALILLRPEGAWDSPGVLETER